MVNEKNVKRRYQPPPDYSLPKAILDILLDLGENIPFFESPYVRMKRLWREDRGIPAPPMWRYNRAIKYLEYREKLKIIKQGDRLFFKLTKKGRVEALLARLASSDKKLKMKWDGKWRLIIWDIPESSSGQRNKIRYFLKNLGFYQLQLSVFVRPHPLPGEAVAYLKESGLLKFIRFLRVDKLDDDEFLREHFHLRTPNSRNSD